MTSTKEQFPKAYISYGKDLKSRIKSTSGSICHLLSKKVIEEGGMVSGVKFDEEYNVIRTIATSEEEIEGFRGSKYVQAEQGSCYIEIKSFLDKGDLFLFIGTPCQVAGLKSFLGKDYDNLICIDFICLGVPPQMLWNAYLEEESQGRKVSEVVFKDKRNGWKEFTFHIAFDNGDEVNEFGRDNPYMRNMIGKLYNRPSCHNCRYRSVYRSSDITVADAWGMEKVAPEMIDNNGTSSVLIRNKKGLELFLDISEELYNKEIGIDEYIKINSKAWSQPIMNQEREAFFETYRKTNSFFQALDSIGLGK